MIKQALIAGIATFGFAVSTPAAAHPGHGYGWGDFFPGYHYHPPVQQCVSGRRIDKRQANQKRRIKNGVRNGQLVKWEKEELQSQQRRIRKAEKRMRSDGCLTQNEYDKLINKLNRASKKIRKLKHNNVRRGHFHHH